MPSTSTVSLKKGNDLVLGAFRGGTPVYNPLTFYRNFAQLKTLNHGIGPTITFTRASNATYFDANGVLQTATSGTPRFDHAGGNSLGLLIEEQRTNLIRNNTMVGAVAGTPGTLPSNGWTITASAGYTINVAGVGVESGINYIDLEVIVAPSSASSGVFRPDTSAVTPEAAYTGSLWMRRISGTMPRVRFIWQDGAGGLGTTNRSFFNISDTWDRYADTFTTVAGSTVIQFFIGIEAPNAGGTFVIRVGMPQIEQGAFASSVIPTTGATATRAADSAVVTPISSFYNQAEGTLFAEASFSAPASAGENTLATVLNGNALDDQIRLNRQTNNQARLRVRANATDSASLLSGTLTGTHKIAGGYVSGSQALSVGGAAPATATGATIPSGLDTLIIGRLSSIGAAFLNGHLRKIAYWPRRLSNSLLQQLTT